MSYIDELAYLTDCWEEFVEDYEKHYEPLKGLTEEEVEEAYHNYKVEIYESHLC